MASAFPEGTGLREGIDTYFSASRDTKWDVGNLSILDVALHVKRYKLPIRVLINTRSKFFEYLLDESLMPLDDIPLDEFCIVCIVEKQHYVAMIRRSGLGSHPNTFYFDPFGKSLTFYGLNMTAISISDVQYQGLFNTMCAVYCLCWINCSLRTGKFTAFTETVLSTDVIQNDFYMLDYAFKTELLQAFRKSYELKKFEHFCIPFVD